MKTRLVSLILSLAILIGCFTSALVVFAENDCSLEVETVDIAPGESGVVNVTIKNNPGLIGLSFSLSWDEGLSLTDVSNGSAFAALNLTKPSRYTSGCMFMWYSENIDEEDVQDGAILSLTFSVAEDAECDETLGIRITFGDAYDSSLNSVTPSVKNGGVNVIDYMPGDVDGNKRVNTLDLILISRYISDGCKTDPEGYNVTLNERAANVNDDGKINTLDLILISRYISDGCMTDPDGYNVTLKPSKKICSHDLIATAEKAATCTEEGNIAYWQCSLCGKYYSDENAFTEISFADTILPISDHSWDDGVVTKEATESEEGEKLFTCAVCGETKTAIIPKTDPEEIPDGCYRIYYYLYDGQSYLEDIGVSNPNPSYYDPATGLTLKNLSDPNYTFNGWYDSEGGSDSTRVRIIPKGSEGEYEVYARWTPKTYTVTLDYDFNQEVNDTYTFGETYRLPISPAKDGYQFISWTDQEDATVHTTIPIGTSGDKYYYANWLSNRNQAWSKKTLDDPIITEYEDKILFAYEIGEIRNVPMDVIKDFGYTMQSGVKMEVDETYSATTSSTQMESLASTVSKSTTDSFAWTLSNEWSNSVSVNQEWMEQNGYEEEDIERLCKSSSNNWYASKTEFYSSDTEKLKSTEEHDLKTKTDTTKTYKETDKTTAWKLSGKLDLTKTEEAKLSVGGDYSINKQAGVNGEYSLGEGKGKGLSIGGEYGQTTVNKKGSEKVNTTETETGTIKLTEDNTTTHGGFNTESGSSSSQTISQDNQIRTALSSLIAKTDRYGEQYISSEGSSQNQAFSENIGTSDETVSSVTYSTQTAVATTVKYTINNTSSGCHRYILAGTAHVYGVVGYDIANQCYFTYTFSVMDDERHMMEDYCPKPDDLYQDHQLSGIEFEIPYEIAGYVDSMICSSEGLQINEAGIVTEYTGTDQIVFVPEYISYRNADGSRKAVKVVGIRADAFQDEGIRESICAIKLPESIKEIPSNAFSGCTSLMGIDAPGITKIGDSAFAGCTELHCCVVDKNITQIGANVFDGLDGIIAITANAGVVDAVIKSGVSVVEMAIPGECEDLNNMDLVIPDTVSKFVFNGGGKTFTNLRIESHAAETYINNATFVSAGKTPLQIDSSKVRLGQVNVSSSGIGLILTAEETEVELYGESSVSSGSGKAMLCRDTSFVRAEDSANTTELMIAGGNILLCGELTAGNFLKDADERNLSADRIERISEAEFANYLSGLVTVNFDANGGSLAEADATRTCVYGTAIGECPTPTRDYYTFAGWFTSSEGGEQVNAATTVQNAEDLTLYAHWTQNPTSGWVLASDAPSDAEIVYTRYSFTHRYFTTSSSSSLAGWTHYNTERTSWGATQGPVYGDPSNGVRNVWSESYVTGGPYYNYYHCHKSNGLVSPSYTQAEWDAGQVHLIRLTYQLEHKGNSSDGGTPYYGYYTEGSCKNIWYKCGTFETYDYGTRWYYQDPVYTYYFYKDVEEESYVTVPSNQDYRNVRTWVQYRPKTVSTDYSESESVTYNGHTYTMYTSPSPITWADAEIFCEMNGGHLAVVTSSGENEVLKTMSNGAYTWIGLSRTPSTDWAWVNGESVSYTDWAPNQPDCFDGVEFFGQYWDGSKWNDCANAGTDASANTKAFILERP